MYTTTIDPVIGIHSLPNEILCQIFLFVVSRNPGEYSVSELELSYVCSRWNAVALSLPSLWSSICVLAHEDSESEAVRRLTELYLGRSGTGPLDLFLHIREASSLMDLLCTQAYRWRRFHLVTKAHRNFLDLGFTELSSLESLSLALDDQFPIDASSKGRMWFNAPRLHTLSLDMTIFELEQFELPWHQLRHLRMEYLNLDQMHKILCLCTSVVTATFISCANDFSFRDPVPYTCLFLSSLTIIASHRLETLGPDITHCIYPSLSELTLISGSQEFSFSHGIVPNLTSLVIRSGCHLTSLTLHGISYSSKHLMELLQAISPSLVKLDLCDVDHRAWNFLQLQKWLIQALIWLPTPGFTVLGSEMSLSQAPGHLLPHLKEFGIRFPGSRRDESIDRVKLGEVLKMVESRRPSSTTSESTSRTRGLGRSIVNDSDTCLGTVLETLHLGRLWNTRIPLEFNNRLRALKDDGLEITAL
ncbi:hypothetical protein F5050DRAFT_1745313 [Lentinula boryana]|uniref:F-box domain-containing protein n=1 Tax=Lentinula boryana TaxID=40481 RepID=A0ABQ8QIM1_9AGAR|nr:hypothetical protein F5050DRAFT_1745313 [Lentinula boryana]